jgi:hypothetical protein
LKRSGFGNPYCSKTYCCNGYCGIVAAVSELATLSTRTRSPVFLADDCLGVSRGRLASDRGRLAAE